MFDDYLFLVGGSLNLSSSNLNKNVSDMTALKYYCSAQPLVSLSYTAFISVAFNLGICYFVTKVRIACTL